jgi:hypothetical protein
MQPENLLNQRFDCVVFRLNFGFEVDAPASPALFRSGTEQEKEVAHCDT